MFGVTYYSIVHNRKRLGKTQMLVGSYLHYLNIHNLEYNTGYCEKECGHCFWIDIKKPLKNIVRKSRV